MCKLLILLEQKTILFRGKSISGTLKDFLIVISSCYFNFISTASYFSVSVSTSLQTRCVLFWQIRNTRVCRPCSHFMAFSDNKFYSPHKKLFKSYPDTSLLRRLLPWAIEQYLPHCWGKNNAQFPPSNPILTTASRWHLRLTEKSSLRLQALCSHFCTLCMCTKWKWRSLASEQTQKFVWLHKQSRRHKCGSGITSSVDDRTFNCLHGKILHYLIIHEFHSNQQLWATALSLQLSRNAAF